MTRAPSQGAWALCRPSRCCAVVYDGKASRPLGHKARSDPAMSANPICPIPFLVRRLTSRARIAPTKYNAGMKAARLRLSACCASRSSKLRGFLSTCNPRSRGKCAKSTAHFQMHKCKAYQSCATIRGASSRLRHSLSKQADCISDTPATNLGITFRLKPQMRASCL